MKASGFDNRLSGILRCRRQVGRMSTVALRILTDPTFHLTVVETTTEQKYGIPERTDVATRSFIARAPLVIFSAEDVPEKGFQALIQIPKCFLPRVGTGYLIIAYAGTRDYFENRAVKLSI